MKPLRKRVPRGSCACACSCVCWKKSTTSRIQSYPSLSLCTHTDTHTKHSTSRCLWAETLTVCYKWLKKNRRERENTSKRTKWKSGEKQPVSFWGKCAWSMLLALTIHVLIQYVHIHIVYSYIVLYCIRVLLCQAWYKKVHQGLSRTHWINAPSFDVN